MDELRKSKDLFFETCANIENRTRALEFYVCIEEEKYLNTLLNQYSTNDNRDYFLKERYLFRDEFQKFNAARQRVFLKQVTNLIDGDLSLWRDSSKPADIAGSLYESRCKLTLLHNLCKESPTEERPITCGNPPDVFAIQRIWLGMVYITVYAAQNEYKKALAGLEDVVELTKNIMALPNGYKIGCKSPSLNTLQLCLEHTYHHSIGASAGLYCTLENGETDFYGSIEPKWIYECLYITDHSRWSWLKDIRKEQKFITLVEQLKALWTNQ